MFEFLKTRFYINLRIYVGFILGISTMGCSTLKDSLILGATSGTVVGGVVGNQSVGDKSENVIKGAVIGGVVFGIASYLIHDSLEQRDANVRRETLMNLEHYDVLGFENLKSKPSDSGKCFTTREVDGRMVSIPCSIVNDSYE